jgi:hypothetical protein
MEKHVGIFGTTTASHIPRKASETGKLEEALEQIYGKAGRVFFLHQYDLMPCRANGMKQPVY